jgi:hypothetical protein
MKSKAPCSSVCSLRTMPTRRWPSSLASRFLRLASGSDRRDAGIDEAGAGQRIERHLAWNIDSQTESRVLRCRGPAGPGSADGVGGAAGRPAD